MESIVPRIGPAKPPVEEHDPAERRFDRVPGRPAKMDEHDALAMADHRWPPAARPRAA
jgi:hypothetical protein